MALRFDDQRREIASWLLSNDLHDTDTDTPALLDLAELGDQADRAFVCSRLIAQAQARHIVPSWVRGVAGSGTT